MIQTTRSRSVRINSKSAARIAALALLALPALTAAQNGPVPEYIETMRSFEVRELDGQYAPSNGNVSMASVTPQEWLNSDPSVLGLSGVLAAWSGGAKSMNTQLYVHGGGHTDSANNGLYVYEFSGDTNPTGWQSPLVISRVADVRDENMEYADGRPNSVHTYDGIVHASHNNHIYRFGGSRYSSGRLTNAAFKYDVANGEWTRLPNYPSGESAAKTIYDPITGKIFVTMTFVFEGHFFRTDSDTWSGAKTYGGNGFPFDSIAAWDTRRNRAILVGEGETSLITIDFEDETINVTSFNPTGDTQIFSRSGISAVYDPVRDVYWLFGGATGSPGWNAIYELRADGNQWQTTRHALTGANIPLAGDLRGSWGRFAMMPQWGAIGLTAHQSSPAFVLKLPDSQVKTPMPPQALIVE